MRFDKRNGPRTEVVKMAYSIKYLILRCCNLNIVSLKRMRGCMDNIRRRFVKTKIGRIFNRKA